MDHLIELSAILQLFFMWNKSRCDCLSQIIIALFTVRTVNISNISESFVSTAKAESSYKRIIRFLSWMPYTRSMRRKFAKLSMKILNLSKKSPSIYR